VINHVLQTLITAAIFREGLDVAGIVLDETTKRAGDASVEHNGREIRLRAVPPVLTEVAYGDDRFAADVDWFGVATQAVLRHRAIEEDEP
jgi:dethiobiotin synthetase